MKELSEMVHLSSSVIFLFMDNLKNYVNFFQLLTQYEIIIFLKTHNQTDILNLSTKMLHNLDFF